VNARSLPGPARLLAGLVFLVSGFVFAWQMLLVPKLIAGIRVVAAGGVGTPAAPPPGFLAAWMMMTVVSGTIVWLTGRRLVPRQAAGLPLLPESPARPVDETVARQSAPGFVPSTHRGGSRASGRRGES